MKKTYSFRKQLEIGKEGESLVQQYLKCRSGTVSVFDVSDEKYYRRNGIDVIWVQSDGVTGFPSVIFADIKTDVKHAETGNLFLETKSSKSSSGNFLTTAADVFIYFDPINSLLFFVPTVKLRIFYFKNLPEIEIKTVKNYGYESEGFCITPEALTAACGAWQEALILPE